MPIRIEQVDWLTFAGLENDWQTLRQHLAIDTVFNDWLWVRLWWETFAVDADAQFVGLVARDQENAIVGLVPLLTWRVRIPGGLKILRMQLVGDFHGGPDTMRTEYKDILVSNQHRIDTIVALVDFIMTQLDWSDFVIKDAYAGSRNIMLLADLLAGRTYLRDIGNELNDEAWVVDTSQSFADYLQKLSQNARRQLFGGRKRLATLGPISVHQANSEDIDEYLAELNRLHQIRWGQPVFSGKRLDFQQKLATELIKQDRLRLTRLDWNAETISVLLNIVSGETEFNLQQGFEDKRFGSRLSLGPIHLGIAIERACNDKNTSRLDLLAGTGMHRHYKSRIALSRNSLRSLHFVRRPALRKLTKLRDKWKQRSNICAPDKIIAILTAAHTITGYTTARAIYKSAGKLVGIGRTADTPYRHSRYWAKWITDDYDEESLLKRINSIASTCGDALAVVFPCDDFAVDVLSRCRQELRANVRTMLPSIDTTKRLLNKNDFYNWAARHDHAIPTTYSVRNMAELEHCLAKINKPAIIKPTVRLDEWNSRFPTRKLIHVDVHGHYEPSDCDLFYLAPEYVVQEWIPGEDHDIYFCLCYFDNRGTLRGRVGGRKLLQWPPSDGNTAYCVTETDPYLLEMATEALQQSGLVGLGSIEFKRDQRDGSYRIIEPTVGRNDHQSHLALAAGANLTLLSFQESAGIPSGWVHVRKSAIWVDELAFIRRLLSQQKVSIGELMNQSPNAWPSLPSFAVNDPKVALVLISGLVTRFFRAGSN